MTATLRNSFLAFIIIIQSFYSEKVFAQFFNLNIGPSFSMGDFKSTDPSNSNSGYAGVGACFNSGLILKHDHSYFAFGGQFFYNQNDFKIADLENQFNTIQGPSINAKLGYPSNTYYYFASLDTWNSWGGMVGLYLYSSKEASIKGFVRTMVGFQSATSFSYSITTTNFFMKQESNSTITPIYLFGGGIQFGSNEIVCFKLGVDYLMSNPNYGNPSFSNGTVHQSASSIMELPFRVMNCTIGMEIKLNNSGSKGKFEK
jgi:hypothetical protein